ncbi:MAG TPA: hypothetical protein ENJ37_07220 [Deltaproteobacteria bacterium]|nr:hypothetical protein [Deltaproteobacteria bacterium]
MRRFIIIATLVFTAAPVAAVAADRNLGDMVFDDKIESMKKAGVGPVIFPHTKHEQTNKCDECHPKVFKEKRGANDVTMKKNMSQQFCGAPTCHNSSQAFPLYMCANCHTKVTAE